MKNQHEKKSLSGSPRGRATTPELSLRDIIKKYNLVEPSEEWILPNLEELIEKAKFVISLPEFSAPNIMRWREHNEEGYEKALRQICKRVLELRLKGVPAHDYPHGISETVGRQERGYEDDVMGRWALTDIAIVLTRCPPLPRGRPKAREEYPIEKWRRMREKGMSIREIAKAEGVPKTTVHRLLSRPENE